MLGEEDVGAVRREQTRHREAAARGPDHGHPLVADVVAHRMRRTRRVAMTRIAVTIQKRTTIFASWTPFAS